MLENINILSINLFQISFFFTIYHIDEVSAQETHILTFFFNLLGAVSFVGAV